MLLSVIFLVFLYHYVSVFGLLCLTALFLYMLRCCCVFIIIISLTLYYYHCHFYYDYRVHLCVCFVAVKRNKYGDEIEV